MNRFQVVVGLAVMGLMSLAGSFLAVAVLLDTEPAGAQEPARDLMTVTGLRLVDGTGKARATLEIDDEGAVRFTLLDPAGTTRVQLSADTGEARVSLLDAAGTPRYIATQTEGNDRVTVSYADKTGEALFLTSLTAELNALIAFLGPDDEKLLTLLAGPEQASTLILADPKSSQQIVTFAGRGQASMEIADSDGKGGFLASVLGDGRSVYALSKGGKLRMRGMTEEDGTPDLRFFDEARNPTWKAGE